MAQRIVIVRAEVEPVKRGATEDEAFTTIARIGRVPPGDLASLSRANNFRG